MLLKAASQGDGEIAAEIAALMSERDLGGRSSDIEEGLARLRSDTGWRAKAMRDLARRWAMAAGKEKAAASQSPGASCGAILAAGFPERIARARSGAPGRFLLAGGRGAVLDETDPLARSQWLAVAELTGAGADLRILLAARLSEEEALCLGEVIVAEEAHYEPISRSIRARRTRRLGAILLEEAPLPTPSPELVAAGFIATIRENGLGL